MQDILQVLLQENSYLLF